MSKSRDIADSAATINYIDTVTSNVQDQIDNIDPLPSQTGNNGLFLTTDGTDASWAAAGGGAWELIASTTTASASSVEFTLSSTYDSYALIISYLEFVTSSGLLICQLRKTSNSTYTSVNFNKITAASTSSYISTNDYLSYSTLPTVGNTAKFGGELRLFNINDSDEACITGHFRDVNADGSNNKGNNIVAGFLNPLGPYDRIKIFNSADNIAGSFYFYGIKKA